MQNVTPDPGDIERAITAEIRAEIAALKMTKADLAKRAGIPIRSLSAYLNDKNPMPLTKIKVVALALGTDLVPLIERASNRLEQ